MQRSEVLADHLDSISVPWVLWLNVPITRRKSFHIVTNDRGEVVFRNRHVWPCVEYLESQDVKAYELRASEPPTRARVAAIRLNEGCFTWLN